MAKVSKEHILAEIRRTAQENGGPAVGQRRFEEVSGIPPHAWRGKYWRAWSDAVVEAGLAANTARQPHDPVALILAFVALIRRLGRFPTEADMRLERERDAGFPSMMSFRKWIGGQPDRIEAVRKYAGERSECSDVLEILPLPQPDDDGEQDDDNELGEGHVYLMKFGKYFKVGRTEVIPTRHRQINLELPEKADLIHTIATDDAVGVEAYWHARFSPKRTNGEWFALSRDDVRAFKRRKFM